MSSDTLLQSRLRGLLHNIQHALRFHRPHRRDVEQATGALRRLGLDVDADRLEREYTPVLRGRKPTPALIDFVQSLHAACVRSMGNSEHSTPIREPETANRRPNAGTGPDDLGVKLAAWLDHHHQREGVALGCTEPAKFIDIAKDLGIRKENVTRGMQRLLGVSGKGQTPHNKYSRLVSTGRPTGVGLAKILARHVGDDDRCAGGLDENIPEVRDHFSAETVADAKERLSCMSSA